MLRPFAPGSLKRLVMRAALGLAPLLPLVAAPARAETPVERGAYLVNGLMACDNCHTPRRPTGLDMSARFSGGTMLFEQPSYRVYGPNITPDPETGIGLWSDEEIKRAITDGVRPDGVPLAPIMPSAFYKAMTASDLDAVVAYLRSLPARRGTVEPPLYKSAFPQHVVPGAEEPLDKERLSDPVTRGFYLAALAHCMECHSRRADGAHDYTGWLGGGGYTMKGPFGSVVVPNITSHKTAGIGGWTDEEVKRALTHAVGRDGRAFKLPMARANYFSRLAPADLDALVAYLRSLPPLE